MKAEGKHRFTSTDVGLAITALVKALKPIGGFLVKNMSIRSQYADELILSVKVRFDSTRLHEYLAQFVLPTLCKGQEEI